MDAAREVIIPVISAAGGAGKTTVTLLLAHFLSENNYGPILMMDLDPTAGLSLRLMGDSAYYQYSSDGKTLSRMFIDYQQGKSVDLFQYAAQIKAVKARFSEVEVTELLYDAYILPPGEDLMDIFTNFSTTGVGIPEALWGLLRAANISAFNTVIIDTAPFFDMRYTLAAVYGSERSLVIARPTLTDLVRTNRMIQSIDSKMRLYDPGKTHRYSILFNFNHNLLVREASTIGELGIKVLSRKGEVTKKAKPDNELKSILEKMVKTGRGSIDTIMTALSYFKDYSDESFPKYKLPMESYGSACHPISHALREFGREIRCNIDVEEM
ncbi:MAG: ParA family protein [Thermocladium sp.]|jgi:chromosome partitioning protein|nr:MAG: hypothetical protein AT710_04565 [Thermocladium sp. ECH_B]